MMSGKNNAGTQPYALGSLLQAATYGATIPTNYGCTLSPLLAIWTANLRQGGSTKKFKQMKKGIVAYCENITFLLGHNPGLGVLQMWNNGGTQPLNFTSQTFTGPGPWTITDANFYAVIGVSVTQAYSETFDDYGATGPVTESGTFQVPLWNELFTGPDPVKNSGYRNYPYCYRWQPSYGVTVQADATDIFAGQAVTIYYAQLTAATSYQPPLVRNRLHFENVLGDGAEYSGDFLNTSTPLSSQQILYPMFFGCGSTDIDLGSSGSIPQMQAEVQGKWGLYSTGDADFADMIEDIFKSGYAQAAIGAVSGTAASTPVEHGLSCYNFPGCVQMKCLSGASSSSLAPIAYNLPPTAGNFLVAVAATNGTGGGSLSISDSAGNTWMPVFGGSPAYQVWYARANSTGPVTVTVTGQGNSWGTSLIEVAGVDTFDSVSLGNGLGAASIATTNARNFPGYMLSIGLYPGASSVSQPSIPQWTLLTPTNYYGVSPAAGYSIQERAVHSPGTYSVSIPASGLAAQCVLAFKCVNPPTYPDPLSDFIDTNSLDLVRLQDRANGLWGSLSMSSQQTASDYLNTLYTAADAAPVFCGFKLFSMPLSEVSIAGNGAVYDAITAGGPVYNLSTENGDFIASGSAPPIQVKTAARVNQPNVLQMQCLSRNSNYNPSVVAQPDQGSIAQYGIRKADPVQNYAIQDVSIARQILGIAVRKLQQGGDVYTFTLPAKWCLLAPMGAGGGGRFVPAPPVGAGGLPLPAVGESVTWATATVKPVPGNISVTSHIPPPDYPAWQITSNCSLTTGSMSASAGFLFLPTAVCAWGGFSLPAGLDPATIHRIYPVVQCKSNGAGSQTISCSAGGPNFGPGLYGGTQIGNDIVPFVGTNLSGVTINASVYQSIVEPQNFASMDVSFVGFAIYHGGSAPVANAAFVADATNIVDAALTITDPLADINKVPVRLTSIQEQNDGTLACEAEPFVYGMYSPKPYTTDQPSTTTPTTGASAGSVNTPIVFEPTPALSGLPTQGEIWAVLSSNNPNYGGCQPYVSTDGGASYTPIGDPLIGSATTGVSTGDWPPHADPDTANNLALNLSESNGSLLSYAAAARDNFQYPCYIAGGGAYSIPYEIFTYNAATLTSANHYTLAATGSGNALRRGIYAAPSPTVGVDHPTGSRFAFLSPDGQGIAKIPVPPAWIGTTVYFKFPTFNSFGGAIQSLASATAYAYTFTGVPGAIGPAGGFQVNGI